MSPENDDGTENHTTSVETAPLNINNHRWKLENNKELADSKLNNNSLGKLNGNTTNTTNNNNNTKNIINGTNNHRWSPLPQEEPINLLSISEILDNNKRGVNNNDWKTVNPSNSTTKDMKNGWKEIPQIEENNGGITTHNNKLQGNNNGTFLNGNSGALVHRNGHPDKLLQPEQDPLTGQTKILNLDDISSCGIGTCRPKWARSFASTHMFMVVFLLAWILQGMYYTYFVSVITTIEKLFQIKSKVTGLLMSATEVGQISTSLFLSYYAGRGHRPRWIACGMILFAFASFCCTLPHFIFGEQLIQAQQVFNGGGSSGSPALSDSAMNLCQHGSNRTTGNYSEHQCENDILVEQAAHSQITTIVLIIFSVSLLAVGVGQTAVSTLGIPYIDDNVASRESPLYIAITIGVRILGPAAGFILGSFCTRIYVDVTVDPMITPTHPNWVGAWWLGLILISSLMILTSLAMFTFPKHLKGNRIPPPMKLRTNEIQKKQEEEHKTPELKDFPKTIKRQLSNDILMFRTASSVLHLLPLAGLYTFLPKYMETQYRLTAHDANLISGVGGILVMGIGIVISGFVILKFSPTARSVAAWIAFTAIVYSCGMAILMFVGCPMEDFKGIKEYTAESKHRFEPICNLTCECATEKFSPICGSDGFTYFSACHAGCSKYSAEQGHIQFTDCFCIPPSLNNLTSDVLSVHATASSGYCDSQCKNFIIFISLFSFFVFMHSTSEVGSMLLIMRCTDPKDKAMAMGIIQFAIGLFGNVPCPIIYGAVVDSACLVWDTVCGKQGACSLYDVDTFRHFFLGTTSGIMLLAFIMDLVVWHKAHRIDIDPESNSELEFDKTKSPDDNTTI